MLWASIAILGYFLLAVANINDKFLISKHIKHSFVYVFFIGLLQIFAVAFIPFGFNLSYSAAQIFMDLITGIFFIFALIFFYNALDSSEASRVIPLVGGATPIFIFIFSYFLLGERLSIRQMAALGLLVLGGVLITLSPEKKKGVSWSDLSWAIFSALAFAVVYTLSKYIYETQDFITGFVWMRMGAVIMAVVFLADRSRRQIIAKTLKYVKPKIKMYYLVNQIFGAVGFIFVNYAISLASVTLVNAVQGAQYIFVLGIAGIITKIDPKLLQENITKKVIIEKVVAVVIILAGLFTLYI